MQWEQGLLHAVPWAARKMNHKELPLHITGELAISFLLLQVNGNDKLTKIRIISDQVLATCKGPPQTSASCHWAHIKYHALPHHRPGTEKHIKLALFMESFK